MIIIVINSMVMRVKRCLKGAVTQPAEHSIARSHNQLPCSNPPSLCSPSYDWNCFTIEIYNWTDVPIEWEHVSLYDSLDWKTRASVLWIFVQISDKGETDIEEFILHKWLLEEN